MEKPGLPGLPGLPYSGTPEHLSSFLLKLTTTFMLIFLNLLNYVLQFVDLIKLDHYSFFLLLCVVFEK